MPQDLSQMEEVKDLQQFLAKSHQAQDQAKKWYLKFHPSSKDSNSKTKSSKVVSVAQAQTNKRKPKHI